MKYILEPPPELIERQQKLVEIVKTYASDGLVPLKVIANYYGIPEHWLSNAICAGTVPFAFANSTNKWRMSRISVNAFWQFETQGSHFGLTEAFRKRVQVAKIEKDMKCKQESLQEQE